MSFVENIFKYLVGYESGIYRYSIRDFAKINLFVF